MMPCRRIVRCSIYFRTIALCLFLWLSPTELVQAQEIDAEGFVQLWRVQDGTLLDTLEELNDRHNQVAFSPNGEILAIGSEDVILWEIE